MNRLDRERLDWTDLQAAIPVPPERLFGSDLASQPRSGSVLLRLG